MYSALQFNFSFKQFLGEILDNLKLFKRNHVLKKPIGFIWDNVLVLYNYCMFKCKILTWKVTIKYIWWSKDVKYSILKCSVLYFPPFPVCLCNVCQYVLLGLQLCCKLL